MKHDNNLVWFDFFRGIAALLVLTGHLRALMFVAPTEASSIFAQAFYFLTGFGHQAVVIFFVLSGFFIIRSVNESVAKKKWNLMNYFLNRIVRLWVVLLPALLLTLLWDNIGLLFYNNAYTNRDLLAKLPGIDPTSKLGIVDFVGNLFFIQTIKVNTYGSNVALWSLANEFWYYLLFPLLYFTIIKYYKKQLRIIFAILFIACILFVGQSIATSFIIWLMGGLAYIIIKNDIFLKRYLRIKLIITSLFFILVLILIRMKINPLIFNDYLLGIATTLLIIIFSKVPMKNIKLNSFSKYISNISYSVYLTHLSFSLILVSAIFNKTYYFNLPTFVYYLIILAIVLLYCILMYYLFERNTNSVKMFIKKRFNI